MAQFRVLLVRPNGKVERLFTPPEDEATEDDAEIVGAYLSLLGVKVLKLEQIHPNPDMDRAAVAAEVEQLLHGGHLMYGPEDAEELRLFRDDLLIERMNDD